MIHAKYCCKHGKYQKIPLWCWIHDNQGWGLLSPFPLFRYFPHFPLLSKQTLALEYDVYIWQVSPQFSCGDTSRIWMLFKGSNRYFCKIENFACVEITNGALVTPTPDHDDIMTWRCFPHYWPFVQGIHQLLVDSQHKGPVMQSCFLLTLYVLNFVIYLHFISLLHIDMTQVLKIPPRVRPGPTYST